MTDWATVVDRIGQLAGGIGAAQKQKDARIAATNYDHWKDMATFQQKYDIARFKEHHANRRADRSLYGSIYGDNLRWGNQGGGGLGASIDWKDVPKLDNMVTDIVDQSPTFTTDAYDDDGKMLSLATDQKNMLVSALRRAADNRPDLQNNPRAMRNYLETVYGSLDPKFTYTPAEDKFNWFGLGPDDVEESGSITFGGEAGMLVKKIVTGLSSLPAVKQTEALQKVKRDLRQKYAPSIANLYFNQIMSGLNNGRR